MRPVVSANPLGSEGTLDMVTAARTSPDDVLGRLNSAEGGLSGAAMADRLARTDPTVSERSAFSAVRYGTRSSCCCSCAPPSPD